MTPARARVARAAGPEPALSAFGREAACRALRGSPRAIVVLVIACLCSGGAAAQSAPPHPDPAREAARARQAMEQRRYDDAARIYAELVRADPEQPGLRLNLGIALHAAGRYQHAAAELEQVVARQPAMTAAWLMLGMSRLKLGDREGAVGPLERVVTAEPRNALARFELADAHLALARADEAVSHFEALAAIEPESPRAWLGAGRAYAAVARRAFERLEETAPDSAYWAALIARSRASQEQYRSAFALYRLALSRDPRVRGVREALAEIYRRTGHAGWADVEERRARAEPPPDCTTEPLACEFIQGRYRELLTRLADETRPEALYWRSLAASELALQAFARLEALPPSPELHAARAESYRVRGLHDLSIEAWQAALALTPGDLRLRSELAQTYWLNQDFEIARPMLEELVRQDPASPRLHLALGDTLLQLQRPDEALPWLEKALDLGVDAQGTRAALARAHARLGQWDRAIPHLEAALPSDDDGSLHVLLGRAYASAGRAADADRMLQRSQELAVAAEARRRRTSDEHQITAPEP